MAPGTPVAVRQDKVYLTSPITGESREVEPNEAAALLQTGWVPQSEQGAEAVRAAQIPGEYVATQPDLGKLGYGLARGVATPLIDLTLPQGNRVHEVLSEDSPWLVGGGEAAGMIGSSLLGIGPVAALEQGASRVGARLGAGNGLVRTAFGRAAQGGIEGAAYGGMNAVTEAHAQNVPLTAQRLGSEILPGMLFGVVLGGTFGGLEGLKGLSKASTLPERIAHAEKSKLDDIFRAGVDETDAFRLAQREFGVKDPGALTMLQAEANGIDPRAMAMMKDSGPVGERMRADGFMSAERLANAEREVFDRGNEYLLGVDEAMKQVASNVKRGHIERMVGEGAADPADIGKLVRDHIGGGFDDGVENFAYARDGMRDESLALARKNYGNDRPIEVGLFPGETPVLQDGRHRLAVAKENGAEKMAARVRTYDKEGNVVREFDQDIPVTAKRDRGAFVDRVLESINKDVEGVLARSLGAAPGDLKERIMTGLLKGQNETIDAVQQALGAMKLSDEALQKFGAQGAWNQKPLEFIEKWRSQLEGLSALPKGVNDNASDIKKLLGNLDMAEQSVLRDRRAVAAGALDDVKKRLADFAEAGERLGAGSGVPAAARAMYEDLRLILEDPTVWGPKFAGFQSRVNQLLHQNIGVAGEFGDLFVKTIGKPDPENPWMSAKLMDEVKVSKALAGMSEPKRLAELDRIRAHLDDQKKFLGEVAALNLPGTSYVKIRNAEKQIDGFRKALDQGVYLNAAQRQAQGLLGYGPMGTGRAVVGAVLGGVPGMAAGMAVNAALNPGKMLQLRAITERMAESTGSRVWRGVSKLLGLKVGDVAREGAGFIGKAAGKVSQKQGKVAAIVSSMLDERGDERARTYSQTIKQLQEARQRLPELASRLDETMPTLEQALPGTRDQMMAQTQRGLDYVLAHLPSQPKMRLYGETAPPLNDHDYEQFVRMAVAATDPPSILEMAEHGELTPAAVAAADYAAPELVEFIRSEAVRAISDHGPEKVPYQNRISASLLLGTPLDESLEPEYIAIQQATHQARNQMAQERRDGGKGGGGETGLNKRYMQSESDRLESGEPPR